MQTDNRFLDDLAKVASGALGSMSGVKHEVEVRISWSSNRGPTGGGAEVEAAWPATAGETSLVTAGHGRARVTALVGQAVVPAASEQAFSPGLAPTGSELDARMMAAAAKPIDGRITCRRRDPRPGIARHAPAGALRSGDGCPCVIVGHLDQKVTTLIGVE